MKKISFLCPTYGRASRQPSVINETLFWYTKQTYPNKELVILNHAPGQILLCDIPSVKIHNHKDIYPSLGDVYNKLIELASGDICLPQDDDDISLPWRAEQTVQKLGTKYEYFSPMLWWYAEGSKPMVADGAGVGHSSSGYLRESFLGKYPNNITKGHDSIAQDYALMTLKCCPDKVTNPKDISYVYRWATSDFHLSGNPDMEWAWRNTPTGRPGTYKIEPIMGVDYEALHQELTGTRPVSVESHESGS